MSSFRKLLLPLVPLYRLGQMAHQRASRPPQRLKWPVVSIGNLSIGGAGKTPLCIALAKALTHQGFHVDVLSRGYGRSSNGVLRVETQGRAEQFGDEPLLIAREAEVPVYVAAERFQAGLFAEQEHSAGLRLSAELAHIGEFSRADKPIQSEAAPEASRASSAAAIHLLDDGFQHRQLARAVDILILNRHDLHDRLLPAGDLREPIAALHRAHVIAIPADEPDLQSELKAHGWSGPIWRLRRTMQAPPIEGPVVAFCAIARPQQFFTGLAAAGLNVASRITFRDHHRYLQHDIDCLNDAARNVGATALITTEKDRVRLGALKQAIPGPLTLHTARLRVEIENEPAAIQWLLARIGQS